MVSCRENYWKTVFILFIFFQSPFLVGQSVNLINYTSDDGLSSNEVHCSFQQSNGNMLFGTDAGLVSFDGNIFKTIAFTDPKKTSSTIFKINRCSNGYLFINTYRNGLFYLDGDSLRPYVFNEKLLKLLGQSFISNFFFTENNNLFFTNSFAIDYRVHKIDHDGNLSFIQPDGIYDEYSKTPRKFIFIEQDSLSISKSTGIEKFKKLSHLRYPQIFDVEHENHKYLKVDDSKFHFLNLHENELSFDPFKDQPELSILHDNIWWVSYNSKLAIFDSNFDLISIYDLGSKIQHLSLFGEMSIIVSHQKGAALLKWKNGHFETEQIVEGQLITSSFKDEEGGVWLSSPINGVYYAPSLTIKVFKNPLYRNQDIINIETNPLEFGIITREFKFGLYSFPDFKLRCEVDPFRPSASFILDKGYLEMSSVQLFFDSLYNFETKEFTTLSYNDYYQYPNSDSILIATPKYGVRRIKKQVPIYFEEGLKYDTPIKTYTAHVLDDVMYVGTDNGIQILSLPQVEYANYLPKFINTRILGLESIGHKLIATSNAGIYISENDTVIHLTTEDGLVSNNCRKIAVQNDSCFWVANKLGLNQVIYHHRLNKYEILTYTKDDGLSSNSINDLSIEGKNLFIATTKGLCYANIENLKINRSSIPFEVDFPSLKLAGFDFSDTLILPEEKRDIYLLIKELSYRHSNNLTYSFSLNDEEKVNSSANSISYGNLEPGYNFITLNVASSSDIWNSKPLVLHLWATPFFYEQLWFKTAASLVLLISIIVSLFLFIGVRDRRRKQQLEMAIANQEATVSKYNALSLQLSPHFIFNSLNNIQYLSISKNYVAVNQFVANLARLTRKILEHSKLQLIPLETEIENLKLYLEIEQIRFEHKPIEIQFDIDPNLDLENLLIPPMIIQPSVENAIWHGLLNKEGQRKLQIKFISKGNGFEIQIRDNGIGLNTKQKGGIRIKGQTSIGVKNTKDRIQLYSEMNMGEAEFSLEELKENDKVSGTLASFKFRPSEK